MLKSASFFLFASLLAVTTASANTTIVTSAADNGAGSLRAAVSSAASGDTIVFTNTLSGTTITLTSGQIVLINNLTIDASALAGGVTVSGNNASGIFSISAGATVSLTGLTMTNGNQKSDNHFSPTYAGAVYGATDSSITLTHCTFNGNTAEYGGAIYGDGALITLTNCLFSDNFGEQGQGGAIECEYGTLMVANCLFSGNSTAYDGGAIYLYRVNALLANCSFISNSANADSGYGGAIEADNNSTGNLSLSNCVFFGNSASENGGAIYLDGTTEITDCTFSGNSVNNGDGGAIDCENFTGTFAFTYILNCTITGNSVTNGSGAGIYLDSSTTLEMTNCIVAGNKPDNLDISAGSLTGANNLTNGNPMLSPLGNYGSFTLTMPPLPGSPAIDAGNDAAVAGLATDARGFPRISGAHVDIGAVELQNPSVTNTADSGPGSLRAAASGYLDAGATITFAPNLSGQTIQLTSGEITLTGPPAPDGNLVTPHGSLTLDASALPGGLQINGNHASRIFYLPEFSVVSLKSLTLTNGNAGSGAAIYVDEEVQLNLQNCSLVGNSASTGGAIFNNGSEVVFNESTLSGNSAADSGGAIYNELDGMLSLNECTLWGNSAANGTGGAIYNGLADNFYSSLYLNQCTVSGNSAANSSSGGIFNDDADGDVTSLINSIVSSNTPVNFGGSFSGTPNLVGGNAKLAPLGNYGGPTPTMPPLPGSPAIDACTSGTSFATDQRGYPRILGLRADLGAVEGIYVTNLPGKLTGLTRLGNGSMQFTFTNLSDASSTVLASTNLMLPVSAWPAAGYVLESPAGSGKFQFNDPQATNNPQRFYRVRSP